MAYTVVFFILTRLIPGAFASIFSNDAALIAFTTWAIGIHPAGCIATGAQICCQQSFMALGQAKVSLLMACLRKLVLLIPLIFLLPQLLPDKVFAVLLAEPISDVIAGSVTGYMFFSRFNRTLERGPNV